MLEKIKGMDIGNEQLFSQAEQLYCVKPLHEITTGGSDRFKAQTRDRGYLTEDELQRFMTVELRRYKQRQIRDIFIFQAFTGLAYADVKKLTFDDIQKSFDGEMWLIAKRKKTGTTFYVKLLPVAKQLIEQYRLVAKNKFIFPVPSNAENMNRTLRRIGKQAGITKWISSHCGRHNTFSFELKMS